MKYFIAFVWLGNGLFCKVLNLVPRHQEIISQILGEEYSEEFTVLIGLSEIIMAFWIFSDYKAKLCVVIQVFIVLFMNVLEFFLVPNLLLWGQWNSVFALGFVLIVLLDGYWSNKKQLT